MGAVVQRNAKANFFDLFLLIAKKIEGMKNKIRLEIQIPILYFSLFLWLGTELSNLKS